MCRIFSMDPELKKMASEATESFDEFQVALMKQMETIGKRKEEIEEKEIELEYREKKIEEREKAQEYLKDFFLTKYGKSVGVIEYGIEGMKDFIGHIETFYLASTADQVCYPNFFSGHFSFNPNATRINFPLNFTPSMVDHTIRWLIWGKNNKRDLINDISAEAFNMLFPSA